MKAENAQPRKSDLQQINATVTSGVAYLASFMLNGVPPVVCESVIKNFYTSVKKSTAQLLSNNA